jgi:ABC-2 type transport system permease protein
VPTQWFVIYRILVRAIVTRGRLLALLALGAVGVVVGVIIGVSDIGNPVRASTRFVDTFGLSLYVPVVTLIFSAASLGEAADDGSLVHLWLRPVRRSVIALAGAAASRTVSLPVAVIPVALAGGLASGGDTGVIGGAVVSAGLGVLVYSSLFTLLGLRTRRSLVWGLAYILLWEGFVASAGRNAARLAVRAYTRSVLTDVTGVELRLATVSPAYAVAVPLALAVAGVVLTTRRLRRMEVA